MKNSCFVFASCMLLAISLLSCQKSSDKDANTLVLNTQQLEVVNEVDPCFQSYNIEMVEVVGGKFWRPYSTLSEIEGGKDALGSYGTGIESNEVLYRKMDPIDLTSPKLIALSKGLAPSYVRTSGTWANAIYFQNDGQPARPAPKGFVNVLTSEQWGGLLDFVKETDGALVTSFAVSDGVRDAEGVWTPREAQKFIDFSKEHGTPIAAAELFNEPTMPIAGGAFSNTQYGAKEYARDVAVFEEWRKQHATNMLHVGPGTVGEGVEGFFEWMQKNFNAIATEEIMELVPQGTFSIFSYHYYGAGSMRVASEPPIATSRDKALSPEWITKTDKAYSFFQPIVQKYMPDADIWITETAQAAGGGDPWANTFVDVFRYLYQNGSLAQKGVDVLFHNTLAASEYSLIDQDTHDPNPNYWAALLWQRLMGTKSYAVTSSIEDLYLFAHDTKDNPSQVTFMIINPTSCADYSVNTPKEALIYELTATELEARSVRLNGKPLELGDDNQLPLTEGVSPTASKTSIAPYSILFITLPRE